MTAQPEMVDLIIQVFAAPLWEAVFTKDYSVFDNYERVNVSNPAYAGLKSKATVWAEAPDGEQVKVKSIKVGDLADALSELAPQWPFSNVGPFEFDKWDVEQADLVLQQATYGRVEYQ